MSDDLPELTGEDSTSAIPARLRRRMVRGPFETGSDVVALRRCGACREDRRLIAG